MTRMVVLGLLAMRPMSGYEIQQYLQMSKMDQWADILPGSIYHALKKMDGEGLVQVQATEQTGHRIKAIYAITQAGRDEFRRLVQETLASPVHTLPSGLYIALNFVDAVPRAEVVRAIDQQIAALEERLAMWNAGEEAKRQALPVPLPEYIVATFANGREHMEADLKMLRRLREVLPNSPELPWNLPPMEEHAK